MAEKVKVWAFQRKEEEGRYLSDGIDCVDDDHEYGDVAELSEALVVIRTDLTEPDEKDLENFKKFMRGLKYSIDWDVNVEPTYEAVKVELSYQEVDVIRERNEW